MTMSGPDILISATDMATKASHKSTVCSHIAISNYQICPCQTLTWSGQTLDIATLDSDIVMSGSDMAII